MDLLHRSGRASVAAIRSAMTDPPSYSAVRALLRILEEKGHVRHRDEDGKYVYAPVQSRESARRSAVRHLLNTFFDGSPERMVVSMIDGSSARLSDEELERLASMIDQARRREEE